MKAKGSFKKLADFWIIPFFAGVFFSIGYELTNRKFDLINHSNLQKDEVNNQKSSYKIDRSKISQPQEKETSAKKISASLSKGEGMVKEKTQSMNSLIDKKPKRKQINLQVITSQSSEKTSSSNKNNQPKTSDDSLDKLISQESNSHNNSEIHSEKIIWDEERKFIETLFNSLPSP